jgi:hypothetical protein
VSNWRERAFEQAEASLIEGGVALDTLARAVFGMPAAGSSRRRTRPAMASHRQRLRVFAEPWPEHRAAGLPAGEQVTLVRVTAISQQCAAAGYGSGVRWLMRPWRRISWRQRLEDD